MDKDTRNAIERATQRARKLLEEDFASQLEGAFDVLRTGEIRSKAGPHLPQRQVFRRQRIVDAIEHQRAAGMDSSAAVADYLRNSAFTTFNRLVALKMLESRELVQECITKGEQSAGYREFCGLAPAVTLLPESAGYRLYIESLFDEFSTEIKVLFDRRDVASVLWPRRQTFEALLVILNASELSTVWGEDETIGWVYQFFNSGEERKKMRDESQAPRNSRELAVRNQFFTPRYVVRFLTDNTLGRIWHEMRGADTMLAERCEYMVRKPGADLRPRSKKDPRDLRVLDPACGSGHFLLYAFDLLAVIYEEAHLDPASPKSEATGRTLIEDYPSLDALRRAIPGLILSHNLHGVDIDPRCAQIAQLALWMRTQRAYRALGLGRADRPRVRRANIVVAEPLVADELLTSGFLARLVDPELRRVFERLIDVLRLAGELGVLLRIETVISPLHQRGRTGDLLAPPEQQIREALLQFLAEGTGTNATQRLFAEDAFHGLGLLAIAESHFDVVLMNPPFGLLTEAGQQLLADEYAGAHNDVFAAFVRRGRDLCADGYVGVISSRSFLVARRLERFRRDDFLPSVQLLWDLGLAVMDAAFVESAAYVLSAGNNSPSAFLAFDGKRSSSLESRPVPSAWQEVDRRRLAKLPLAKVLYKLPERVHSLLSSPTRFEPTIGTAREGMKSFQNIRFLRLWWEVDGASVGTDWKWYAKGGAHSFLYQDFMLLLDWRSDGAALQAINFALNGSTSQVRQASDYWFRAGATYSRRSARGFSARALPLGCIFSDRGPAVLLNDNAPVTREYLLGWINSRLIRGLIHVQANASDFQTGILKDLPWGAPSKLDMDAMHDAVASGVQACVASAYDRETSPLFRLHPKEVLSYDGLIASLERDHVRTTSAVASALAVCDRVVDAVYQDDSSQWTDDVFAADDDGAATDDDEDNAQESGFDAKEAAWTMVSKCIGVALGRFHPTRKSVVANHAPNAFAAIQVEGSAPSEWTTAYAVDDEGHPRDLYALVHSASIALYGIPGAELERGVCSTLDVRDLRELLRSTGTESAWGRHLRGYSSARRKAPIYWRLSTHSGAFSIWIAYHALGKDTWFKVVSDVLDPRIALEEQRLSRARQDARSATDRRLVSSHETLLGELRAMREIVRGIAPIWSIDRNDGVLISASPLWPLFSHHKPWQKELKATWEALCEGGLDWTHLAMHLWPERVVSKCGSDRSLAIAHGLEEVFWVRGEDGKWIARASPTRSMDALVRERMSPAVTSALKSLFEASPESSGAGRRQGRGRRIAAVEGGEV